MVVEINSLKLKERVPKQCSDLYWELRNVGAIPSAANWLSKEIQKHNIGKKPELHGLSKELFDAGIPIKEAVKISIQYWNLREPYISPFEAGFMLHVDGNKKITYTNYLQQ